MLAVRRIRRVGLLLASLLILGGIVCFGIALTEAPLDSNTGGNLVSRYSDKVTFQRNTLTNIVPEIDQLKLGTVLLPFSDPFIDGAQGKQLREAFLSVYREMREDPEFVEVGSALGFCYEDLFLGKRRTLHSYEYLPEAQDRKPLPVIIFLHGSLGNFKGYLWVLKSFAEDQGIAVVAPTFGAGNWERDENGSVVSTIYERCKADPRFDPDAIYLAGLSNGGKGVTRELRDHGDRYKGLVLISPILEPEVVGAISGSKTPVLIIHGDRDRRIPLGSVEAGSSALREKGFPVRTEIYTGEDHFLFFSQRERVVKEMRLWMEEIR